MSPTERTFPVKTALHDAWALRPLEGPLPAALAHLQDSGAGPVPATVPGCVHTDLLAADLIADPYLDENERLLEWIGHTSWRYSTTFRAAAAAPGERVDLDFEGLDTVATVSLNGTVLGSTANMHRSHRFDVRDLLVRWGQRADRRLRRPDRRHPAGERGPRASSARQPLPLQRHPQDGLQLRLGLGARAGDRRDLAAGDAAPVDARHASRQSARSWACRAAPAPSRCTSTWSARPAASRCGSRRTSRRQDAEVEVGPDGTAVLRLELADVSLWWPRGHGEQPLYPVRVRLLADDDELDDVASGGSGFRTVDARHDAGRHGTPFTLRRQRQAHLRARRQLDPRRLLPEQDRPRPLRPEHCERHRERHEPAAGLGRRDLRERRLLRDLRRARPDGLAGLPLRLRGLRRGGAAARRGRVAEAREAVTRLTPHPSLVLWNGCNENIWGHEDWGWKETLGDLSWGMGYYTEILPAIVAELDPARPYSAGSPWSLDTSRHPNDPDHGTMHIWDVWNQVDYTVYGSYVPRLASEFGYQGPPAWSTLTRAVHDEPLRARLPRDAAAPEGRGRRRQAHPRPRAAPGGPGGHGGLALGDVAATRPGPSPSASSTSGPGHRAAPAPSSGS